ncbi:MAG: nucleotide exchange factor GrpE, partial [Deltaproteobacteria bacterium]|nr:nucleotide exchange factor GrpE [Deltaproteobacteria bacterium]
MSHPERPKADPKEGADMGAAPPGNEAPESLPVDGEEVDEEAVEVLDQEASEDTEGGPEPEALEDDEAEAVVEVEPTEEDRLRARIEELEAEMTDRTAKLRAVSKAYTDLQEDLDAFRTRTTQQFAIMAERRAAEVVEKFFDPVQNLRRSLEAAGDEHGALIDGLKMILQQFIDSLQKLGLEQVPGVGSDFDPNVHEALAVTPVSEPGIDGKVLMVHNAGYMVKG